MFDIIRRGNRFPETASYLPPLNRLNATGKLAQFAGLKAYDTAPNYQGLAPGLLEVLAAVRAVTFAGAAGYINSIALPRLESAIVRKNNPYPVFYRPM